MTKAPSPTRIPNNAPPVKYTSTNSATNKVCIVASEVQDFDAWGRPLQLRSNGTTDKHANSDQSAGRLGNKTKSATPHQMGIVAEGRQSKPELTGLSEKSGRNGKLIPVDVWRNLKRGEARAKRYELQSIARILFWMAGKQEGLKYPMNYHRTCKCLYVSVGKATVNKDKRGNAFYAGIQVCGSVWSCPVCCAKVQERRRIEIEKAIEWSGEKNLKVVMITLTFPHRCWQKLEVLIDQQEDAMDKLRAGKNWTKLHEDMGYVGLIKALELTHGGNGWHPHTHELWFVKNDADVEDMKSRILKKWTESCIEAGLLDRSDNAQLEAFHKHAVDIKDDCKNSSYFSKGDVWGADREMAKSSTKEGKSSGRHPFEILATAEFGNKDGDLFLEYAIVMKGKRQLVWSRGLKKLVGVEEKSDQQVVEEDVETSEVLATITRRQWKIITKEGARTEILDLAETKGYEGLAAWFARHGESLQRGIMPDGMQDEETALDWKLNRACMAAEAKEAEAREAAEAKAREAAEAPVEEAVDLADYQPESALKDMDQVKVAATKAELQDWRKKESKRKRDGKRQGEQVKLRSARDLMLAFDESS